MQTHRWLNRSQPQNLQNATILLYFNAVWAILFGVIGGGTQGQVQILVLAGIAGGYGMANDKKWGYYLSCVVALFPLVADAYFLGAGYKGVITFNIIFQILLVVLLLSKITREYVRIWFK